MRRMTTGGRPEMLQGWSLRDLRFVVETLVPERVDTEHVALLLQDDEALLEAMLQDDRLFRALMDDDDALLAVSPQFFFRVLLRRARRDMETEIYTVERRQQQKVVLFDANQVVELLANAEICDYLATMLASFTRTNSITIPIRVRPGIWRRLRINDLDVDSLVAYANSLEDENRFWVYRRIGDACLFLTGIFPEHIDARQRYPLSGQPRKRARGSLVHSLEDYESYGQTFYRLAAGHKDARVHELGEALSILSSKFILAEKPLSFVAERYLALRKHRLFASAELEP